MGGLTVVAPDEELWGTMWSLSINKSTNDEGEMIILLAESQRRTTHKARRDIVAFWCPGEFTFTPLPRVERVFGAVSG